jgi:phosphoserine phosphatase RsbU/P
MSAASRRDRTIRGRLTVVLLAFDFLLTVAFAGQMYFTQRQSTLEGIDTHLSGVARGISYALPDGFHDRWIDSTSIPDSVYVPLSRELQAYADANGVNYAYSFMKRGERILFFVSSNADSQFQQGNYVGFGKPYDEASAALRRCFSEGGLVIEDGADEYGSWRSALVRRTTAGGQHYVLGADIDVRYVDHLLRMSLVRCALIGLVGFVLFLIVTLRVADSITVPIVRLEQQTRRLVAGQFNIEKYDTSVLEDLWKRFHDESGRLAYAFLTMLKDLAEHIRRLEHETALRNRAESEMKLAGEIQRNYLPGPLNDPAFTSRMDLFGSSRPARSAGGDLFDYMVLDERRIMLAVGDVSDKGMAAAMFMAITVTLFRDATLRGLTPVEIATAVNSGLVRHNDMCQFVTLWFGVLDLQTGAVDFVNAGHNPPFVRRVDGAVERLALRNGTAMGVAPEACYTQGQVRLGPGDTLVLYSDGVTEAFNTAGQLYAERRLVEFIKTSDRSLSAEKLSDALWANVAAYVGGAEQSDDITTLVVRITGGA